MSRKKKNDKFQLLQEDININDNFSNLENECLKNVKNFELFRIKNRFFVKDSSSDSNYQMFLTHNSKPNIQNLEKIRKRSLYIVISFWFDGKSEIDYIIITGEKNVGIVKVNGGALSFEILNFLQKLLNVKGIYFFQVAGSFLKPFLANLNVGTSIQDILDINNNNAKYQSVCNQTNIKILIDRLSKFSKNPNIVGFYINLFFKSFLAVTYLFSNNQPNFPQISMNFQNINFNQPNPDLNPNLNSNTNYNLNNEFFISKQQPPIPQNVYNPQQMNSTNQQQSNNQFQQQQQIDQNEYLRQQKEKEQQQINQIVSAQTQQLQYAQLNHIAIASPQQFRQMQINQSANDQIQPQYQNDLNPGISQQIKINYQPPQGQIQVSQIISNHPHQFDISQVSNQNQQQQCQYYQPNNQYQQQIDETEYIRQQKEKNQINQIINAQANQLQLAQFSQLQNNQHINDQIPPQLQNGHNPSISQQIKINGPQHQPAQIQVSQIVSSAQPQFTFQPGGSQPPISQQVEVAQASADQQFTFQPGNAQGSSEHTQVQASQVIAGGSGQPAIEISQVGGQHMQIQASQVIASGSVQPAIEISQVIASQQGSGEGRPQAGAPGRFQSADAAKPPIVIQRKDQAEGKVVVSRGSRQISIEKPKMKSNPLIEAAKSKAKKAGGALNIEIKKSSSSGAKGPIFSVAKGGSKAPAVDASQKKGIVISKAKNGGSAPASEDAAGGSGARPNESNNTNLNENSNSQSTTINENNSQSTTINENNSQSTTINENNSQSTTINESNSQSTTINENNSQSTTINESSNNNAKSNENISNSNLSSSNNSNANANVNNNDNTSANFVSNDNLKENMDNNDSGNSSSNTSSNVNSSSSKKDASSATSNSSFFNFNANSSSKEPRVNPHMSSFIKADWCPFCQQEFTDFDSVVEHIMDDHDFQQLFLENLTEEKHPGDVTSTIRCSECHVSFRKVDSFSMHVITKHATLFMKLGSQRFPSLFAGKRSEVERFFNAHEIPFDGSFYAQLSQNPVIIKQTNTVIVEQPKFPGFQQPKRTVHTETAVIKPPVQTPEERQRQKEQLAPEMTPHGPIFNSNKVEEIESSDRIVEVSDEGEGSEKEELERGHAKQEPSSQGRHASSNAGDAREATAEAGKDACGVSEESPSAMQDEGRFEFEFRPSPSFAQAQGGTSNSSEYQSQSSNTQSNSQGSNTQSNSQSSNTQSNSQGSNTQSNSQGSNTQSNSQGSNTQSNSQGSSYQDNNYQSNTSQGSNTQNNNYQNSASQSSNISQSNASQGSSYQNNNYQNSASQGSNTQNNNYQNSASQSSNTFNQNSSFSQNISFTNSSQSSGHQKHPPKRAPMQFVYTPANDRHQPSSSPPGATRRPAPSLSVSATATSSAFSGLQTVAYQACSEVLDVSSQFSVECYIQIANRCHRKSPISSDLRPCVYEARPNSFYLNRVTLNLSVDITESNTNIEESSSACNDQSPGESESSACDDASEEGLFRCVVSSIDISGIDSNERKSSSDEKDIEADGSSANLRLNGSSKSFGSSFLISKIQKKKEFPKVGSGLDFWLMLRDIVEKYEDKNVPDYDYNRPVCKKCQKKKKSRAMFFRHVWEDHKNDQ